MSDKMLVLTTAFGTTVEQALAKGTADQQLISLPGHIPEIDINMAFPGLPRFDVIASHEGTFCLLALPERVGQEPAMLTFSRLLPHIVHPPGSYTALSPLRAG